MRAVSASPGISDLDPSVEGLLERARPRRGRPLRGRELVVHATLATAFLGAAGTMALLLPGGRPWSAATAVALVVAFALVSRIEFDELGPCYTVPTELVLVPMLFLVPVGAVPLLVAAGFAVGKLPSYVSGETHPSRALLAVNDAWHAVGPALVLGLAGASGPAWSDWPLYVAALVAQFAFDFLASSLREWLANGVPPRLAFRSAPWTYAVDALLAPLGLMAAFASADSPYAFLLVLPLVALFGVFAAERRVRTEQALALSHAYRGTAMLLGDLVEDDDAYTGDHSRGVVSLALRVADDFGLDAREGRDLEFAALLHDVGKVTIPKEVLHKAGPLTQEEMALMRTHTIEGHRILGRFGGVMGEVGRIVRACHERWDGQGYPDGLAHERIPLAARIIFACDAYNAMTTDRPYRAALSAGEAVAELEANAGEQFDPMVVQALVRAVGVAPSVADAPPAVRV
jgi:HD-GYP domain-containing protein (c-di-GMP phosphodiesterase class II)